jgi:hypothetical protein
MSLRHFFLAIACIAVCLLTFSLDSACVVARSTRGKAKRRATAAAAATSASSNDNTQTATKKQKPRKLGDWNSVNWDAVDSEWADGDELNEEESDEAAVRAGGDPAATTTKMLFASFTAGWTLVETEARAVQLTDLLVTAAIHVTPYATDPSRMLFVLKKAAGAGVADTVRRLRHFMLQQPDVVDFEVDGQVHTPGDVDDDDGGGGGDGGAIGSGGLPSGLTLDDLRAMADDQAGNGGNAKNKNSKARRKRKRGRRSMDATRKRQRERAAARSAENDKLRTEL